VKRPSVGSDGVVGSNAACTDERFAKLYPTLLEYLTDAKWDDGKDREVSTLTISLMEGCINLALNDRALSRSLYTTAETLMEALKLLEGSLASGKSSWRSWKAKKK